MVDRVLGARRGGGRLAACAAACLALAWAAAPAGGAAASAEGTATTPASPCGPTRTVPHYTHVVVIAFENHSYASVLGSSAPASYFKTLAARCATATRFTAVEFPHSLPDYLAVTAGTLGGITGDCLPGPGCRLTTPSIFGQLGPTRWRVWAQSMLQRCAAQNAAPYVARHNAPLYFTGISAQDCATADRPLPTAPPNPSRALTWIVPDVAHDMTQNGVANAGAWLKAVLAGPGGLLSSRAYAAGNTAIVIWFDSAADTDAAATPVPLIVVAPSTGHRVVATPMNDYHLLHGIEGLLGLPCLSRACGVSGFDRAFRL